MVSFTYSNVSWTTMTFICARVSWGMVLQGCHLRSHLVGHCRVCTGRRLHLPLFLLENFVLIFAFSLFSPVLQGHNKLVWKRVKSGRRESGRPYVALGRGSVWLAVRKDCRPTASSKSSVLRPLLQEARGCVGVSLRAGRGRRGSRDCARADGAPCAWGRRAVRAAWWLPDHVIFRCGGLCDCRLHCFRT
jgi:hypothetical protein